MRFARRLIVAVLCLAAFDRFVPRWLEHAERRRYEETPNFRFVSSDLFGLGPLVSYLREHPRGDRPRTVFLGNSVIFGFELPAAQAVPGQFQALHSETMVLNAAINGFDFGSNVVVASALVDAVDRLFVLRGADRVNPRLGLLIPVDKYDLRFERPNPLEQKLQSLAEVWNLYASTYRLQAAWFGTSTREFIHQRLRPAANRTFPSADDVVRAAIPRSPVAPTAQLQAEWRQRDAALWRLCGLTAHTTKRVTVIQIGAPEPGTSDAVEIADFNAACDPYARVVTLIIPSALVYDGRHLTPIGARRVAEALP